MNRLDCLHFLLGKALQQVNRISKEMLAPYGITPVQFGVLYFLWQKDGQNSSELGKQLQMDSATMTGIIDRLEQGGFIERKATPNDRRYRLIYLTEKGDSLEEDLKDKMNELDEVLLSEFEAGEAGVFKDILMKIGFNKNLESV